MGASPQAPGERHPQPLRWNGPRLAHDIAVDALTYSSVEAPGAFPRGVGQSPAYTQKEHLGLALAVTCAAVLKILRCSGIPGVSAAVCLSRVQRYDYFLKPPNFFEEKFCIPPEKGVLTVYVQRIVLLLAVLF